MKELFIFNIEKQYNFKYIKNSYYIRKILKKLLLIIIFSIFFKYKNKQTRICLCTIGKNENLYAKEFLNHYKKLGFNHIYIYDNNNNKSESFFDFLREDIKEGFISIIDYIGYRGKYNNSQREAYYDCYKKNKRKYDWLSFFDFDEFLILKNQTIQEFLDDNIFKNCQIIKINWLYYTSNKELLYYEKKPLQIRFNKPENHNSANRHIKSIVRGNLKGNYWKNWLNPHSSSNNYLSCSSSGKIVDSNTAFIDPPDYKHAFLKHFGIKSFEEFCYKLKKGWPDSTNNMIWIMNLIKSNKNNFKKVEIVRKIFKNISYYFF